MLNVENISFSYQKEPVLKNIDFSLEKGTHLAIIGESGSGKSTLLKAIYGLLQLDAGSVHWNSAKVLGPNFNLIPGENYMKYVSQDFDLMPFTTVFENVAEHLSVFEMDTHQPRVDELLNTVSMTAFANAKVKDLSGGQKQRVALAKALAQESDILLLDEPFSSIDQFKKYELRHKLFPYLKERGVTIITATHDPEDVLAFADEVLVLKDGVQIAHEPTQRLYDKPKEKYVASLFGQVNELPIKLLKEYAETDAKILVYPHEFQISKESGVEVYVIKSHFKGSTYLIEGVTDNGQHIFFSNSHALKAHVKVFLNIPLPLVNKRMINN
ncbi:ABC transporter ATP-binding protein [Allomuricauda sp. SCSIO 65647]|uniref:ABC transporter ATP-binding protein n=1 Tax=Allomuricauda sp. SCSIO 65647 TaxID=2908843 RepID=UPI001F36A5CB|nr:ABC transporter ATP-binding protein [Muricauda sp. SCSIO 65647]UJH69186.1 ABC transporter ATP-binding protein [Muricauda sp. SCSIO 65647]